MSDSNSDSGRGTRTPPYVSWKTFKTFSQDLHEHGVPSRIDRSVLSRFSGVVGTQLMTALRFFELIDGDGQATPRLRELVEALNTPAWAALLGQLIRSAYSPLFTLDLETATPSHFTETFRKAFPGSDAVLQKSAVFFLYAAQEAGITISPRVLKGRRPRQVVRKRPARGAASNETHAQPPPPSPPASPPVAKKVSEVLLDNFDPKEMDDDQQTAIWTLLRYFKAKGL
jgi:hypothetical protein